MQEPEMSYEQYEVHCPIACSWMNEATKTHNRWRKRGKGFVAVLQVADQHWGGRKVRSNRISKRKHQSHLPWAIRSAVTTLCGSPASILPQSQVPKEPFASLPSAQWKGITFWWRKRIGRAKLADQNKRQGIISLKIIPCILLNNLTNKIAKYNLFYSAHRLGTVSSPGHTHYSKYMDQHHPRYDNILKVWCSVITIEQIF